MQINQLPNLQREGDSNFTGGYLKNPNGTIVPPKSKQKLSELSIADLILINKFYQKGTSVSDNMRWILTSTEINKILNNIDWDN